MKITRYNHNDLCDFDERTKRSHKSIENNLRLLRTWGLQLSGECNGQDCLHLNLFSTRQVYPALFLFLNVESVSLPRKKDNPSFTSLSRITEMMICLAVSTLLLLFGYKYPTYWSYSVQPVANNYDSIKNSLENKHIINT